MDSLHCPDTEHSDVDVPKQVAACVMEPMNKKPLRRHSAPVMDARTTSRLLGGLQTWFAAAMSRICSNRVKFWKTRRPHTASGDVTLFLEPPLIVIVVGCKRTN